MKLGVITDQINMDFEEAIKWGTDRGIDRYEIRNVYGKRIPYLTSEEIKTIAGVIEKYNITITAISPGLYNTSLYEDAFFGEREKFMKSIRLAKTLNVNKMLTFGIKVGENDVPESYTRVVKSLGSAAEICAQKGIVLCAENEPGFYNDTSDNIYKLHADLVDSGIYLNWDVGNLFNTGEYDYKPAYEKLKQFIGNVHIKDVRKIENSIKGEFVVVGTGDVDWKGQINDLIADNIDVDMSIETFCQPLPQATADSYEYIKNLLK